MASDFDRFSWGLTNCFIFFYFFTKIQVKNIQFENRIATSHGTQEFWFKRSKLGKAVVVARSRSNDLLLTVSFKFRYCNPTTSTDRIPIEAQRVQLSMAYRLCRCVCCGGSFKLSVRSRMLVLQSFWALSLVERSSQRTYTVYHRLRCCVSPVLL